MKRRISIQLHIDPRLQNKYLNPEEKKGKERSHVGYNHIGRFSRVSLNHLGSENNSARNDHNHLDRANMDIIMEEMQSEVEKNAV